MNAAVVARSPSTFEHRFFVVASSTVLLIVFVSFAHSFFLKVWFGAPALSWLVHLHGALMSAWFALFFVQTCLVARHRVDWHRRLGVFGALLAAAIVVVGPIVLARATMRELHAPDGDPFFISIFGVDLVVLLDFAILVASALALRRRSDYHKRLMLLATLSIVLPAIARLHLGLGMSWAVFYVCVLAPVAVDTLRHRRLHPVFGWGAPLVLASQHLAFFGTQTAAWAEFVKRLFA